MDIKKINTTILNEVLKKGKEPAGTGYQVTNDKTYCCINGHIAFAMNDDDFVIDKSKLKELPIDKFFTLDGTQEVFKSGNKKEIIEGKKTISFLEFECDDFKIYIDEKLYKFLGKTEYKFYAKSPNTGLMCVSDNEIKVMICPVKIR